MYFVSRLQRILSVFIDPHIVSERKLERAKKKEEKKDKQTDKKKEKQLTKTKQPSMLQLQTKFQNWICN